MREAYLSGDFNAPETPETEVVASEIYSLASLTYEGLGLKVTGTRFGNDATDEFAIGRSRQVHPDLAAAFAKLTLHLALLTEHLSETQVLGCYSGMPVTVVRQQLRELMATGEAYVATALKPFYCTGLAWKPKGIVLSGVRQPRYRFANALDIKTATVIVADGLDEDDLEENDYGYYPELRAALDEVRAEAIAYLGGKYGGEEQLSLFDQEVPSALDTAVAGFHNMVSEMADKGIAVSVSAQRLPDYDGLRKEAVDSLQAGTRQADEAAHIEQLQRDAAGDESTGLGTIPNPKPRPARRKAVKGESSND